MGIIPNSEETMSPHVINTGIGVAVWVAIWLNYRSEHKPKGKKP